MIVFNGVSLDSVAGVKIVDIHVSPIQSEPVARERAVTGGSVFVRNRDGVRTVTITFALLKQDMITRQAALDAISAWAKTDGEYMLELPGHTDKYLVAVCTDKPDPSLRQWWESNLRLVFTCFDNPYWNAKGEKSVACGTAFNVLGDAPPLMRIERTVSGSAASNQSYALDSRTITFSSIPVGNMVIDLNKQTAVVGTTDIMQYYNVNSKFLIPRAGSLTITGTGTVKYRERWK